MLPTRAVGRPPSPPSPGLRTAPRETIPSALEIVPLTPRTAKNNLISSLSKGLITLFRVVLNMDVDKKTIKKPS